MDRSKVSKTSLIIGEQYSGTSEPKKLMLKGSERNYLIFALVFVIVALAGYTAWRFFIAPMNHDTNLIKSFQTTSGQIYKDIADANPTTEQSVLNWRRVQSLKALDSGLKFQDYTPDTFVLCGSFDTGKTQNALRQLYYSPSQLSKHPSGDVCVQYSVDPSVANRPFSHIAENQLVVALDDNKSPSSGWTIDTRSIDTANTNYGVANLKLSSVKIVRADGTTGQISDVKLGNVVSFYENLNVLAGDITPTKLVITNPGTYSGLCAELDSIGGDPTPICPSTTTNLVVTWYSDAGLSLESASKSIFGVSWPQTPAANGQSGYNISYPIVLSPDGGKISYDESLKGATVDLIYSGSQVSEIQEVSP